MQLVSLAACRRFLIPTSYPYSDSLRDTKLLALKLAQIISLQRKKLHEKPLRTAHQEPQAPQQQQQQEQVGPAAEVQESSSPCPAGASAWPRDSAGLGQTGLESDNAGDDEGVTASRHLSTKESREMGGRSLQINEEKRLDSFLPVPTSGPWAACGKQHKHIGGTHFLPLPGAALLKYSAGDSVVFDQYCSLLV